MGNLTRYMVQEKALILSFALFILLLSCILLTPHNALRAVMSHYTLYFLLIAFSVFGVLLLGNHMELSRPFRGVSMKSWIILLSIMVMAFYLYMVSGYCASESRILWEYVFSAGGMLKGEVDLLHPDGYSFILMMLFSVFGNNYGGILILSALITSLTAFAVFLITYYIFRSEGAALLAALVFSLLPNNIMYTQGLVPQVPSLLFVSLSFLFLMISIDTNKTRAYSLSLATLIIAVSMRIENIMFTVLFVIGFLAFRKQTDTRKLRWPLMLFIFLMLQFSYFYIYADNLFGAESFLEFRGPDIPTFSLLNIPEKLPLYASALIDTDNYSPLLLLFIFPIILCRTRKTHLLYSWIVVVILSYSTWSFVTSTKLYMSVLHPVISVLMGAGMLFLGTKIMRISHAKQNNIPIILVSVLIPLTILSFYMGTDTFASIEEFCERDCVNSNTICMLSGIEDDACIFVDKTSDKISMDKGLNDTVGFLASRRVMNSPEEFENCERGYYLNLTFRYFEDIYGHRISIFDNASHRLNLIKVSKSPEIDFALYEITGPA